MLAPAAPGSVIAWPGAARPFHAPAAVFGIRPAILSALIAARHHKPCSCCQNHRPSFHAVQVACPRRIAISVSPHPRLNIFSHPPPLKTTEWVRLFFRQSLWHE